MFKTLQKVGKSFMLPIAILPAAGLLLGIGGALSNPNTLAAYPWLDHPFLQAIFTVMRDAGNAVFVSLPLLLSIGLCIGLSKRDKGTAALAGIVGYITMEATIASLLSLTDPDGIIDTGVIGSLVIGAVAVWIHNRYNNIQLPQFLGFFGGSRFVPIATAFAGILVGAAFWLVWPPIQVGMVNTGEAIAGMGVGGTFLYGSLMRLSGAFGLHHMIYPMFWYTPLGGTEVVAGTEIAGAQNIFFAQIADPNHTGLFTDGTRFFAGRFATMMFGLVGASLAMWQSVPKDRRAKYTGLFVSVALTSFITGITEPIEFMFLFVAPWLYVIHAILDGISFLVADLLHIRIGNTFSGGFIDFMLFGVLQGNGKTNWIWVIPVGILWFFIYYFLFKWLIKKFKVATPGHLEDTMSKEAILGTDSDDEAQNSEAEAKDPMAQESREIVAALGGVENLEDVDACITRLRVAVHDPTLVDKERLKQLGAIDVFEVSGGVQAIYGAKAVLYKNAIIEEFALEE